MIRPEEHHEFSKVVDEYVRGMRTLAHVAADWSDPDAPCNNIDGSIEKYVFGDLWLLFYGMDTGIEKVTEGSEYSEDLEDHYISDREWVEHYDKYGSGPYGHGLEIGKYLAYNTNKFEFTEPEESNESGGEFTFIDG